MQELREAKSQPLALTAEVTGVFLTEGGRPVRVPPAFHDKLTTLYIPDAPAPDPARGEPSP
jgi:acyl-CoA thioesterase FadM